MDLENLKKSQRIIDEQTLTLKEKIADCLHGDEELDHVIRERNLKKPEEWPQFQVYDLNSNKSIFDQNRLFEKKGKYIHRNFSQSPTKSSSDRNYSSPRENKHIGRSSSTDTNILASIMSNTTRIAEEPSNRSSPLLFPSKSTNTSPSKRSQMQEKSLLQSADSRADSQNASPSLTHRPKLLSKNLSLPRLRRDGRIQGQYSGVNSTKFSMSTERTGGMSPSASTSGLSSMLMSANKLTGAKESYIKNFFALTEPKKEDKMMRIMQELNKKDELVQKIHKRLKIPELMSEASVFLHKGQTEPLQKSSSTRGRSKDLTFYAMDGSGQAILPTNSNALGTTTLPKITELSLELPTIKRVSPRRLEKLSLSLSKVNISLEPVAERG